MSEFGSTRIALVEKINEYSNDQSKMDIVIESFICAMIGMGWSTDDQLELLLATANWYKSGYVYDKLMYELTAIKVNNGY